MIPLEIHILTAMVLDRLIGDPRWLPHPVKLMGRLAMSLESPMRRLLKNARLAGLATSLVVIGASVAAAVGLLELAGWLHPLAADGVSILLLTTCLAARDLAHHSRAVYQALAAEDLLQARQRVSWIIGRDTDGLDAQGVTRGAVESVAENLLDGVTAPLLFAAVAGPVGAIAYKAASTLDSTFGYKNQRYRQFGWASARLDDLTTWCPARLTGPVIAAAAGLLRLQPGKALRMMLRDRCKHASPNSAYPEAAFAGALGVQLGGPTQYEGLMQNHPTLGDPTVPLAPSHILQANALMWATSGLFLTLCLGARVLTKYLLLDGRIWP